MRLPAEMPKNNSDNRAVISEYDTSIRSHMHSINRRMPWSRPQHNFGNPFYSRQYIFPERLIMRWKNPYNLLADYPSIDRSPVARLGAFVRQEMVWDIEDAMLHNGNVLDVSLNTHADTRWQTERPELFYAALGRCVLEVLPQYDSCIVERRPAID